MKKIIFMMLLLASTAYTQTISGDVTISGNVSIRGSGASGGVAGVLGVADSTVGGGILVNTAYRQMSHWVGDSASIVSGALGVIDSARVFCTVISNALYDSLVVTVYTRESAVADCDLVATSTAVEINNQGTIANSMWVNIPMSGTLVSSQPYIVSITTVTGGENNMYIWGANGDYGDVKILVDATPDLVPPSDLTGFGDNNKTVFSALVYYH